MKKVVFLLLAVVFISCNNSDVPDVSSIEMPLEVKRFEHDFFKIDTSNVAVAMQSLQKEYPGFLPDFVNNILGLDIDSVLSPGNPQAEAIRIFLRDYKPLKDSADVLYKDFSVEQKELVHAMKLVKYYFPAYTLPHSVVTFIGPLDANFLTSFGTQGDVLTEYAFGVGLQLHLGGDFSVYKSNAGQVLYPEFISRNFDREHITINCMRNVADDMFPDKTTGKALLEQMVEKGKKLYLVSKFLPYDEEYNIIGYTKEQMKAAYENEAVIWDFFLTNDLLNSGEQDLVKNYIGESPKTQEFGDQSPGNLGSFAGWQIVKKYTSQRPELSLQHLMEMDPREIYSASKYKPR